MPVRGHRSAGAGQHLTQLHPALAGIDRTVQEQVKRDALYAYYVIRQDKDLASLKRDEAVEIPADFQYDTISGLSTELRLKLDRARPASLGHAARIDGMTPSALLLVAAQIRGKVVA